MGVASTLGGYPPPQPKILYETLISHVGQRCPLRLQQIINNYEDFHQETNYSRPSLIRKIWDQTMFGLVKCSDWQNLNFRGRKEVKKEGKRVT